MFAKGVTLVPHDTQSGEGGKWEVLPTLGTYLCPSWSPSALARHYF